MNSNIHPYMLPGHIVLREQALRFGSSDPKAVDVHPLQGLLRFGPHTLAKLSAIVDPIRIAIIAPAGQIDRVKKLLKELQQQHKPQERRSYLPDYPGFAKLFRVQISPAGSHAMRELPGDLTEQIKRAAQPHQVLAETLTRALNSLKNQKAEFDVVFILLSKEWEVGFFGNQSDDFNLHDYLKAVSALNGFSTQILNETRSLDYRCRCSVAWRLGIALYTKAGGVPWVLAEADSDSAYIGIDYALRPNAESNSRFAICCSQVFDAEGSGLEFVAYEADDVRMYGKNPFLHRHQMMKVIVRSLSVYQKKHSGKMPRRIVIHKNTEFKQDEISGVFDAALNISDVELVHVQQSSHWRGIQISKPKSPDGYPCLRGSMLQLGEHTSLLWTQGNLPILANDKPYYKEGKGIPEPLMLNRFAGYGTMDDICRETLALTKMDWNNDGPYDRMPVTLSFAGTMASVVKQMPKLNAQSYPVRLFM